MAMRIDAAGPWSYLGEPVAGGPVTCATCGCRLRADQESESWFHFAGTTGHDARGCRVECALEPHDHRGRPTQAVAA